MMLLTNLLIDRRTQPFIVKDLTLHQTYDTKAYFKGFTSNHL